MSDKDYYDSVKDLIAMQKQALDKLKKPKQFSLGLKAVKKAIEKLDKETTTRLERL